MSENIKIEKEVYDSTSYSRIIDTKFSQLKQPPLPQENIEEDLNNDVSLFFEQYQNLFYNIPMTGVDSHQELIQQSSQYINYEKDNGEIEALQNEITQLRTQLLEEQKRNLSLSTGSISTNGPSSTNGSSTTSTNSSNSY